MLNGRQLQPPRAACAARTSSGAKSRPSFFLYQSRMRPTKGEMRAAPASAHAAACAVGNRERASDGAGPGELWEA